MDDEATATDPQDFNQRVAGIEQILPTLATNENLRAAIAPLATREEVRAQIEELRRHMDVIAESLRSEIQLLAERLASVMPRGNRS